MGNFYLNMEETADEFFAKADFLDSLGDHEAAEMWRRFGANEGHVFKDTNEIRIAYQNKQVHLHTRIALPGYALNKSCFTEKQNHSYLVTTVGKVIFNEMFPATSVYQRCQQGQSAGNTGEVLPAVRHEYQGSDCRDAAESGI